jgi:plastocyanin
MERFRPSSVGIDVRNSGHPRGGRAARVGWHRGPARILLAGLLTLVVLAALGADVRAQSPVSVEIQDGKFLPTTLTISVGTTVRWINRDEETHTVTSDTGLFGSRGLDLGEEFTYTFAAPGQYPYTCDLHPTMQGTITVK